MTDKPRRRAWFARIRWPLFLASLTGLGVGLHVTLPPLPRWTIPAEHGVVSADGKMLITCSFGWLPGGRKSFYKGPLETWDTATGQLIASIPEDSPLFDMSSYSTWLSSKFGYGRHCFAVVLSDKQASLGDIQTGRQWTITLPTNKPVGYAADKKWLKLTDSWSSPWPRLRDHFVFQEGPDSDVDPVKYHVVEASTGELLATLSAYSFPRQFCFFLSPQQVKEHDLLVFFAPAKEGPLLTVWSVKERRVVRTIAEAKRGPSLVPNYYLTSDGKEFVTSHEIGEGDAIRWDFWNLRTGTHRTLTGAGKGIPKVSPDGFTTAFPQNLSIDFWDGQNLHKRATLPTNSHGFDFSPDSRFIWSSVGSSAGFSVWSVETAKRLWQEKKGWERGEFWFSPDSRFIMHCNSSMQLEIRESLTGKFHWTISLMEPDLSAWSDRLITAGECVAYAGDHSRNIVPNFFEQWLGDWYPLRKQRSSDGVVVVGHIATKKEIMRLRTDPYLRLHYLSPDGRTLIIGLQDRVFQAWDLPPRPRWGWVLGVPAGLLAFVLLMKWMLAWRKRGAFRGTPIPTPMP